MDIKGGDGYWLTGDVKPAYSAFEWHMGVLTGRVGRLRDTLFKPLDAILNRLAEDMKRVIDEMENDDSETN